MLILVIIGLEFNVNLFKRQAKVREYLKYWTFCIPRMPKPGYGTQMLKCPGNMEQLATLLQYQIQIFNGN